MSKIKFIIMVIIMLSAPAMGDIAIFQHGGNGYERGRDSAIRVALEQPIADRGSYEHWSTNGGSSTVLEVGHFYQNQVGFNDKPGPIFRYGKMLLRFARVYGTAAGQIAPDTPVTQATLTLHNQEDLGSIVASTGNPDNRATTKNPIVSGGQIRISPLLRSINFGTSDGLVSIGEVTAMERRRGKEDWAQGCPATGNMYALINICGPADAVDHDESASITYTQPAEEGLIDIDVTSILDALTGYGVLLNVIHDPNNPILPGPDGPNHGAAYRSSEHANIDYRPKLTLNIGGSSLPGDANDDGLIDVGDWGIVGANFSSTNATLADGDFTGDGNVDVADLGVIGANWTAAQADSNITSLIPEPTMLGLFAAGLILLLRRKY